MGTKQDEQLQSWRRFLMPMFTVLVSVVLLELILQISGLARIPYVDMSGRAAAVITDEDGTVLGRDLPETEWILDENQTLTAALPLPDEAPYEGGSSLVFWLYNATARVRCGDEVLAEVGFARAEEGKLIGDLLVSCEIPEEDFGKSLTIEITSHDGQANSFRTDYRIMKSSDVRLYPLIDNALTIILFFAVFIVSLLVIVGTLLGLILRRNRQVGTGFLLFLFCFLLSIWYLGYKRAFYIFSVNEVLNATAEYYAMYLELIPVMLYFYRETASSIFRKFCGVTAAAFSVDAVISFAISLSPIPLDLSDVILYNRIIMVVMILGFIVRAVRLHGTPLTIEKMILIGLAVSTAFALLEVIAIYARTIPNLPAWLQTVLYFDYAAGGILLFISILVSLYIVRYQTEVESRARQSELERLAYEDQLTGIPNRAMLEKRFEESGNAGNLTVVFMDVDHLKRANDEYGHKTGDRLLREVACSIRTAYEKAGGEDFYGRWGGDEFLAVFGDRKAADEFRSYLRAELGERNSRHVLPFPIAVSAGTESGVRDREALIARADRKMYERKSIQHGLETE